jgi:hypothetical protein
MMGNTGKENKARKLCKEALSGECKFGSPDGNCALLEDLHQHCLTGLGGKYGKKETKQC